MKGEKTEHMELANEIIRQAREVIKIEADAVMKLNERVGEEFVHLVSSIRNSPGRLIVSGIGKSGIVGRKFVATFTSTGTRALFLHPVEAMHGDLGMVCRDDIFLALSNSGETDEINILIPVIRSIGCKIVAFTGNPESTLAENSDIVIDVGVEKEACPLGLAPTASTTALLAMGDALAVVLIHQNHFRSSDFKKYHPGGALGHRLSGKVRDIMLTGPVVPIVYEGTLMEEAIKEIDRPGLGATLVRKTSGELSGIITDGDIRRAVAKKMVIHEKRVEEIMTADPKTTHPDSPAYDALNLMERHQITILPITDNEGGVAGILHLHDILGKGEFKFNGS